MKEDLPLSRSELIGKLGEWKYRKREEVTIFVGCTELVTPHEALVVKQEVQAKQFKAGFRRQA